MTMTAMNELKSDNYPGATMATINALIELNALAKAKRMQIFNLVKCR